jgi:protein-disulfide isomerase
MRKDRTTLVLLMSIAILVGGCLNRPQPRAMPSATPALVNEPPSTSTAASIAYATATLTPEGEPAPTSTAASVSTTTSTPRPKATRMSTPTPSPVQGGTQAGFTERGEPFRGDPAAPVIFEEFSSYQCGFCGRYFMESFAQVIEDYVETGEVLYVFRDFPLPSQPQSSLAAGAANCAGEMGGGSIYWAMHDILFQRQAEWSGRGDASDIFARYADELGLGEATFGECLGSEAIRVQAEADVAEAIARGVRGTPTFFINGQPLVGAQPYAIIAQAIDAMLDGKTSTTLIELAPLSAFPSELRQLPPQVQEAYRFALANPDVLAKIPCYCGCNQMGHMNNRMCYIKAESADGQVILDDHAIT